MYSVEAGCVMELDWPYGRGVRGVVESGAAVPGHIDRTNLRSQLAAP